MINTTKKIVYFDLETTGIDIAKDRIVQFAAVVEHNGVCINFDILINPMMPIPKEASDVHGITNEMVQNCNPFNHHASLIREMLEGAVLVGYNLANFDVPLLAEEFLRCGLYMPKCPVIDAGNLFKKKEERTLSAAVKFYCNREMEGAHNALNDVKATRDVLHAQLERYTDLSREVEALEEFTRFGEKRVDFAGKFAKDQDGDYIYNFGKNKGMKVKQDPSFARWMLGKDFTKDTLAWTEQILHEIQETEPFI